MHWIDLSFCRRACVDPLSWDSEQLIASLHQITSLIRQRHLSLASPRLAPPAKSRAFFMQEEKRGETDDSRHDGDNVIL